MQSPQIVPLSQNRLLAALPPDELERLAPHFQPVPYCSGTFSWHAFSGR
jgi:hypothetical protein